MQAGKMRDRITIEGRAPPVVDDDSGPQPGAWLTVANRIAAEVQDALPSRSESTQEGLQIARGQTRVRFRYRPGITSAMRVVVHGADERVMSIVGGPAILGNREGIEIMCETYSTPEA